MFVSCRDAATLNPQNNCLTLCAVLLHASNVELDVSVLEVLDVYGIKGAKGPGGL